MNSDFVYTYKEVEVPSRRTVVITPLIYLLGGGAIGFTIACWSFATNIPIEKFISSGILWCLELLFFLIFVGFLMKRYRSFFFSDSWKTNLNNQIKVGLKWSIPFIIIVVLASLMEESRVISLENYIETNRLTEKDITMITVVMISLATLVASFLEELIFRGMIQRHIKKFVSPSLSVLISAGIFTVAHVDKFFVAPVSYIALGMLFITGIFTGFAFNKADSCISSFIPHLVINLDHIIIVPVILAF